jgi:hypothetical protein
MVLMIDSYGQRIEDKIEYNIFLNVLADTNSSEWWEERRGIYLN